jgi:Type I phosphodiesterase / nucleotide pyrophosphatase
MAVKSLAMYWRIAQRYSAWSIVWPIVMLCVLAASAAEAADVVAGQKTRHVVILVIDGPRWTETWGRPGRDLIPVRANVLAPQGVWFSDMANDGPTYTNAGHTALVTGFHQEINNSGLELPRYPTLSQRLIAAGAEKNHTWIVASKDKLQILSDSSAPEWKHVHIGASDCGKAGGGVGAGYRDDQTTMERAKAIITAHRPRFMLINLKEPDSTGHGKDWDGYLAQIRVTDAYAGALWKHLQADPEMRDRTALFITNDHGRHLDGHLDGFVSHGDDCAGCRKIELLAIGPDFRRGATVDQHRSQIDVAVTCAALLGLTIPGSKGQIMQELFSSAIIPWAPVTPVVSPLAPPAVLKETP